MKRVLAFAAFLLVSASAFAQQEPLVSHYMFNHLLVNPAYAGSKDYAMASLLYRNQWTKLDGAPKSIFGSIQGPVFKSRKVGLGLTLSNDKIGVTNTTEGYVDYAYHVPITNTLKLGIGVRGGISYMSADLTKLLLIDQSGDQVFAQGKTSKVTPNFGAGLFLHSEKFYLGLSVPRLLTFDKSRPAAIDGAKNHWPALVRHYWISSGVAIEASEDFVIRPSVMLRYSKNTPLQADINTNVLIKKLVWLGATFRTGDKDAGMPAAVVGIIELQLTRQFRLGYSYDFNTSVLNKYASGSHEISLGYDFGYDISKIKSPRYF